LLDVPSEKVSVVLHGIDGALWSSTPQPDDAERVSALGVKEPFLLYVLQALKLADERGAGVTLAWAGRLHADQRDTVMSDIARLQPPVKLLGFVDDAALRALYRRALALLFVSRAEGFGYPLLESMASGCPVIAADRSSLPEVLGDAAQLVDPESPPAIADAIVAVSGDAALRTAMVERGIRRARELTLARQAEETIAAYSAAAAR
jgi:glycosyltransferase involved in cell wall biosynthesis